jgi:hypothetical protein
MSRTHVFVAFALVVALSGLLSGQTNANNYPNPFRTMGAWGTLPSGRTWGATSAVEVDLDGRSVWVAERCGGNDCAASPLAPILKFDATGALVRAFGESLFAVPHGIDVDRQGNIWVTDAGDGGDTVTGKGHQVFKFSPDGLRLLTLGTAGVAGEGSAIVSSIAIGLVVKVLDMPTPDMQAEGIVHAIGSQRYAAPQATLMATLARGILSYNLDWQFVMVGVFIAVTMELCNIKALAFAIGLYLPLATTLPIFAGGALKGFIDWRAAQRKEEVEDTDLGKGSLFATGLIAGGALAGVVVALLSVNESVYQGLQTVNAEHGITSVLGSGGYHALGAAFFVGLILILYRTATKK